MELTTQEQQTMMYALQDRINALNRLKYSLSGLAVGESVDVDRERARRLVERVAACLVMGT